MEDIIEENDTDQPKADELDDNNEEELELDSVLTMGCKMGKEEIPIREAILEVYKQFFKVDTEEFPDDDKQVEKMYPSLCDNIYKKLVSAGLGEWTVVAGCRFSSAILFGRAERYASYKIARLNVAVLEI